MERYTFSAEIRTILERLKQPIAIYQAIDQRIVPLIVSDGFCKLFGYSERDQAVQLLEQNMFKGIHPDDKTHLRNAARQFAEDSSRELDIVYRTRSGVASDYHVIHLPAEHYPVETREILAHACKLGTLTRENKCFHT